MGMFADSVGELPGRAEDVRAVAQNLATLKTDLDNASTTYESAPGLAPSWEGASADAFDTVHSAASKDLRALVKGIDEGRASLDRYASDLEARTKAVEDIRIAAEILDTQWDGMSAQEQASQVAWVDNELNELTKWYQHHVDGVRRDAAECAAELRVALHIEAVNMQEIDGQMVNIGDLDALTDTDIQNLLVDMQNMDWGDVNQGKIGDCYFLAVLISMMHSEEGRAFLRGCIRTHFNSRENRVDGFFVTIYDDPTNPNPEGADTILVTDVYKYRTRGDDRGPTLVSLFEAAYAQGRSGGTRSNVLHGGIADGFGVWAMKDLTGNAADLDINAPFWDSNDKIIETINDGRPVTTGTGPGMTSPSTMTTMDGTELQVPKSHEFAVIAADENGVTLVNPHGRNKTPDGKTIPGGEFKLDWDEFNYVFRGVSLGGEYPE